MLFLSEVLLASKSLQTAIESFDILHLVVYSLDWQRCALDLLVALVLIPRVGVLIFNSCQFNLEGCLESRVVANHAPIHNNTHISLDIFYL